MPSAACLTSHFQRTCTAPTGGSCNTGANKDSKVPATIIPFVPRHAPRLSTQECADLIRWAVAAAPFGIAETDVFFCENEGGDTGYEVVSIVGEAGEATHHVFRPHGARCFVALALGMHQELGRFATLLDALNAVRPVVPAA